MKRIVWMTICGLVCQAGWAAAGAGTVYESSLLDRRTNAKGLVSMQVDGDKLRVEQSAGTAPGTALIYRGDTVYALNPKDKSYVVVDRASIKKMADQVGPALRQMQQELANLPPAQRAMMESMMGGQAGAVKRAPPTLRPTERTEKVAGYSCKVVQVFDADVLLRELCVAPPAQLKGGQEVYDAAAKMGAMLEEIVTSIDAPWLTGAMAQQMDNFGKLGGVPLATRTYEQGKLALEVRLQAIRSEALAASRFEVPADFQQRDFIRQ
jgi:hypothetical protein